MSLRQTSDALFASAFILGMLLEALVQLALVERFWKSSVAENHSNKWSMDCAARIEVRLVIVVIGASIWQ